MPPDTIELTTPSGRDWDPVVRLVLGGIADRLNLGFEELDDLQLAVERLLLEAGSQDSVKLSFEISENGRAHPRSARCGPHRSPRRSRGRRRRPGELTLRRILETVVDSFGVEQVADDEQLIVRLEKVVAGVVRDGPCLHRSSQAEDRELLRRYHEEGDRSAREELCSATCRWCARSPAATPAAASRSTTSSRWARSA